MSAAEEFVGRLQRFRKLPGVFNPWRDWDRDNDISRRSREQRAEHLVHYLREREGRARTLLVAEAPGYQGCHFSGIPMTSERILLGHQVRDGIAASDVILPAAQQTSRHAERGVGEPTATVVWKNLKQAGIDTRSVVLWNAFAFHPMADGPLSNRAPTRDELKAGRRLLLECLALFPGARVLPVGRVAEAMLAGLGVECEAWLRHPARGGAGEFAQGLQARIARLR